jgi:hypothetical protein
MYITINLSYLQKIYEQKYVLDTNFLPTYSS